MPGATDRISKIEARAGRHLISQNFSRFAAGPPLAALLALLTLPHALNMLFLPHIGCLWPGQVA